MTQIDGRHLTETNKTIESQANPMTTYNREELQEALRAIISTNNKCEKAILKLNQQSAQRTLLERRIKAFRISVHLIEKELSELECN